MNILDYWIGELKWYRSQRGGSWFKIGPGPSQPACGVFWIKGEPKIFERVYAWEDYA